MLNGFVLTWSSLLFLLGFSLAPPLEAAPRLCRGADASSWNECRGKLNLRGARYEGYFRGGKPDGQGLLRWDDGAVYRGDFQDGKFNGTGTLTRVDRSSYEGAFQKGVIVGFGLTRLPNGSFFKGEHKDGWPHGLGEWSHPDGSSYEGEVLRGLPYGKGKSTDSQGRVYIGEHLNGKASGAGTLTFPDGRPPISGEWEGHRLVKELGAKEKTNPTEAIEWSFPPSVTKYLETAIAGITGSSVNLRNHDLPKPDVKLILSATTSAIDDDGAVHFTVQVSPSAATLRLDDREERETRPGRYEIKRYAKIGRNNFIVSVRDRYGKEESKTIEVLRHEVVEHRVEPKLSADRVPRTPARDSVVIVIGVERYKRSPKADYAAQDAKAFYDYSRRAFGAKTENTLLLTDDRADMAGILRALSSWLPARVNADQTEIFLYFSGHGLPSRDGHSTYLLPHDVDPELLERTAISNSELIELIRRTSPKSALVFLDSCFSGLARTGEALLPSLRPLRISPRESFKLPDNFTVMSASASDEISSSSPTLGHGLFSYFLMRGLEGSADEDKDQRISVIEMEAYLSKHVTRAATDLHRTQRPQVFGDRNRILLDRGR